MYPFAGVVFQKKFSAKCGNVSFSPNVWLQFGENFI